MKQKAKGCYHRGKEVSGIRINSLIDIRTRKKLSLGSKSQAINLLTLLKLTLLMNIMFSISSHLNNNSFRKFQNYFSEITIDMIVNDEELKIITAEAFRCPDEIYLDGSKIAEGSCSPNIEIKGNLRFRIVWFDQLTSCKKMFYYLSNIISIDLSKFDSSLVTDMSDMFSNCNSLKFLNLMNLNTSLVQTMTGMFSNCYNLTSLDLSHFDTSSVISMDYMFGSCRSLVSLDLSNFDTSKVQDMKLMFEGFETLKFLDLSNFDTSSVTSMRSMFQYSTSLISLKISNFNTSLVETMINMFDNCISLISIDVSTFNTSLVRDMRNMFSECKLITYLNLSNFNTMNVLYFDIIFSGCNSLIKIDFLFNTSSAKSMSYMFSRCFSIVSLNLSMFDTSSVLFMNNMFYNCSSLISLDLSNFQTSLVERMDEMFRWCSSLKFLDISKFNTSSVYEMDDMFDGCSSLKSLDLSTFNTSKVTDMSYMFENCISLESLDLSTFDTSNVIRMNNMFDNCISLEYLDLSTFDTSKVTDMSRMFYYCENLKYINLDNFIESNELIVYEMFSFISEDIIYCINEEKASKINELLKEKTSSKKDCSINWQNNFGLNIINVCNASEFFEGSCKINNSNVEEKKFIGQKIINDIMDGSIDTLLLNVIENKISYIIREESQIYQISTISYQKENKDSNLTIIDLGKCENILKKVNGIDDNEELIIFRIDNYFQGLNTPIIEYVLFNQKGNLKLNLSYCDEIPVKFYIPLSLSINQNELYKYNSSSQFYNDGCYQYTSEYGTDITLYDRKNDYNEKNLSLCEVNCQFKGYNSKTLKVECECKIKNKMNFFSDIHIDKKKLIEQLINIKKISNIWVVKCYNLVFSKKGLITNIGSYVLLIIILINIIFSILFCKKGYILISETINKIIGSKFVSSVNDNKINIPPKRKEINKIHSRISNTPNNIIVTTKNTLNTENDHMEKELDKEYEKNKEVEGDKIIINLNDYELNSLSYEDALKYDHRTYLEYYLSLLRTKQLIIFTFYTYSDYNSKLAKISLFFFSLALFYIINALFFNDSTMHKIYEDQGDFNFIYQIPQILYSTIISIVIKTILSFLSLTEKNIITIKSQKTLEMANTEMKKQKKCIYIKFIIFFIFNFIFLALFWYYISCFCSTYENTQIYLIKDTAISFGLSLIYPFFINLIPGFFRIYSLNNQNKTCIYRISKIIQLI